MEGRGVFLGVGVSAQGGVCGSMIISLLMNINLGHLGGASIFAKIHL